MAVRTTPTLVSGLLEVDPAISLDPYIFSANELVTDRCTASGYTGERLELIERWLSAHFYSVRDRTVYAEGVQPGPQQTFDRVTLDLFLNNTLYGQQALSLDTAGNLAALVNELKVIKEQLPPGAQRVRWLGTPRCRE